jgi:hypothetical protein
MVSRGGRRRFLCNSTHVHAVCPCSMSLLHVPAACSCCMYLLHVSAACPCYMFLLHVPAACICYMSLLHVPAACSCCFSMLLVHVVCPCCMTILNFLVCQIGTQTKNMIKLLDMNREVVSDFSSPSLERYNFYCYFYIYSQEIKIY